MSGFFIFILEGQNLNHVVSSNKLDDFSLNWPVVRKNENSRMWPADRKN